MNAVNPAKDRYIQCSICGVRMPPDKIQATTSAEGTIYLCVDRERCRRFLQHAPQETP